MINKNSTKEDVIIAVRQWGGALCFASYELQDDREVVLEAVKESKGAIKYASDELQFEIADCWVKCMEGKNK